MWNFIRLILIRILSYFIFIMLIFIISTSLVTGQFPPSVQILKGQYQNLLTLRARLQIMAEKAAHLNKIGQNIPQGEENTDSANLQHETASDENFNSINPSSLEQLNTSVNELRREQIHLQSTLNRIEEQNKLILEQIKVTATHSRSNEQSR